MTPADARTALATARTEADQARELVEALAERVRGGDQAVTAEQIGGQRQLAELAGLRVEAAERKLATAVAADRDARARAIGDRVRDLVAADSTAPLIDAVKAVMGAVAALVDVASERRELIRATAVEGVAMNDELGRSQSDPWPSRAYGFMAQTTGGINVVAVDRGHVQAFQVGDLLGVALAAALAGQTDACRQLAHMVTTTPEAVEHTAKGVPGLAEALRCTREEYEGLARPAQLEAARQGRAPVQSG
ncbi:hypothetical protein LG634_14495 [Streptomyces bambusae]|uniref:hypothetical protein n=1 Tax=Streptomyces bambusae TaxID=1550616 RepID=UPI001CFF220B|nr:hypothetical protein [Streptomyces bambusae]MCB5166041.1 hypothetical protein [Streptomyces bambusae]